MIDTMENMSLKKKQMMIGMAKRLLDDGLSVKEVSEKLQLSEDTIRAIKRVIDEAEKNRNK